MGEHGTWFDFLGKFSWWNDFSHWAEGKLGRTVLTKMFPSGFSLTHVLFTCVVLAFITWAALSFRKGTKTSDKGLVPPRTMNLRNFTEYLTESVYGMVEGAMGAQNAPRFFPLIGALWFFILFSNFLALIPGSVAPTDTLKTNVGIALAVFFLTHYYGVKEHGLAYFKHFLGPSPALIPLMLPIELISHFARPLSLAVRLMGNMMADHMVVGIMMTFLVVLLPVPFLLLGTMVAIVQTLIFTLLSITYIGLAVAHAEGHH